MGVALLQFVGSAVVIIVAGSFLTRYSDRIADLTGLGRLLVGSILLAGATSLPELTVGFTAVRQGWVDLTVGNLVGATLFNLLTLAVVDLLHQSKGGMLSRAAAGHALSATMSILLLAITALGILVAHKTQALTLGPLSLGTALIGVSYLLGIRMVFYDQRMAATVVAIRGAEVEPAVERTTVGTTVSRAPVPQPDLSELNAAGARRQLSRAVIGFVLAAAAILVTAPLLATAAEQIADLTGLGRTFVGTTLIALCTTMPELVATLTAARIGAFDLALGNVFGSNCFNLLLLVILDLGYGGSLLGEASPAHVLTCLSAIVVTAVAVIGQLYQVEKRIRFLEPDAVLVIAMVFGALAMSYYLR